MINDLVNKSVEVIVAFSASYVSGGSVPELYKGTLIAIDDEFCKIRLEKSKSLNKNIIISRKYIISVKEI